MNRKAKTVELRLASKWILSVTLLVSVAGCSFNFDRLNYWRAQRALAQQNYRAALPLLRQVMLSSTDSTRAVEIARKGSMAAHLDAKDYTSAIEFYRYLVLKSPSASERLNAQASIAQIYFESLQDLNQAVLEYEKLLKLDLPAEDRFRYRLNVAKAHFQLNNLDQALAELNALLDLKPPADRLFEIKVQKARILMAGQKLELAAATWNEILKDFPERSIKDNVALNLVVCYEELKDFERAIEVLESMRQSYPNPEFVDSRIARLKERRANLPGAQGLRR